MSTTPVALMARYAKQDAAADGDHALWGFKLQTSPIPHRRFREGMFRIAELHHGRRTYQVGGGLLLIGPSGAGKSTLIEHYESLYPREHAQEGMDLMVSHSSGDGR